TFFSVMFDFTFTTPGRRSNCFIMNSEKEFMMKQLLRLPGVVNVKSNITLKKVKSTHVLPLDHLTQPAKSARRMVLTR
ncbi:MAG TPA: hypothetical protein VM406_12125, partial [Noviherbaspirillum sp.]|nr:hypothetical protein [Noviherbaspirillum sp.]